MSAIGFWLFLLVAGPVFLWLGVRTLRTRAWHDGVPAVELLIDRIAGAEPPPRNATDRRFARLHAWMMVLIGSFFSLVGLAVLYSSLASE